MLLSSVRNKLCVSPVLAINLVKALSISRFCIATFSLIASYSVTGCLCVYNISIIELVSHTLYEIFYQNVKMCV